MIKTIKHYYNKLQTAFNTAVWVLKQITTKVIPLLLGLSLAFGFTYTTILEPNHPDPATLTYDEWVQHRAEWLKNQPDFLTYVDDEAEQTVNMKADHDANRLQRVYKYGLDANRNLSGTTTTSIESEPTPLTSQKTNGR